MHDGQIHDLQLSQSMVLWVFLAQAVQLSDISCVLNPLLSLSAGSIAELWKAWPEEAEGAGIGQMSLSLLSVT